jgi:hypothetical protein
MELKWIIERKNSGWGEKDEAIAGEISEILSNGFEIKAYIVHFTR